MKTVASLTVRDVVESSPNKKLIMHGVSWCVYEQFLKEYEDSNALHFAYDDGILEIEMPTEKHEFISEILSKLIIFISLELNIDAGSYGSTTFRKQAQLKGVEPDKSFYIQNEAQIRGNMAIDLSLDPPPDLVIEVDITSPSIKKLPIYAALKVPEVWLYEGETLKFYQLDGDEYRAAKNSVALPILSSRKATDFLDKGLSESPSVWAKSVREWARKQSK